MKQYNEGGKQDKQDENKPQENMRQGHDKDGKQEIVEKNRQADSAATHHGQASYRTGSTTQGGSNHGQGSMHLGGESYQQGDAKNAGANYGNESGVNLDHPDMEFDKTDES